MDRNSGLGGWHGSGGVDPDMFQIWHSDPKGKSGYFSDEAVSTICLRMVQMKKAMLNELNDLIMTSRSTIDTEERKLFTESTRTLHRFV